jgi:predicted ATPase
LACCRSPVEAWIMTISLPKSLWPPLHSLKSVRLQNLLSFGPDRTDAELGPLNVLIGPNTAGKSNFIDAISLLAAAPRDLATPLRQGGGTLEWIWDGPDATGTAVVEAVIASPFSRERPNTEGRTSAANIHSDAAPHLMRYSLGFAEKGQRFELMHETLVDAQSYQEGEQTYLHIKPDDRKVFVANPGEAARRLVNLGPNYEQNKSLLAQRQEPVQYPEITYLARLLAEYRFFRDWNLGRHAELRRSQHPDLAADFLLEDASNLAVVINDLEYRGLKPDILKLLRRFYPEAQDLRARIAGGTIQINLVETGRARPVPAARLSDGTLRFLCLVSILLHPEPPPLICLEEPELGMHPDVLPILAEMLIDASTRTQLIVTTHSPELIDALSDTPESVIVCERTEQGTQMERLDPRPLKEWIDEYRLGGAWKTGVIGGRR